VLQTIVGRFLAIGINLMNGILTARNLGADGRGVQAAMTLWPQFLCFILTLGIPFGLLYHARSRQTEADSLCSTALTLSIGLGAVATVVGILFIPVWLHKYSPQDIHAAQELMLFAPMVMVALTFNSIFEIRFDFTSSNILRYLPAGLTLIGLICLMLTHHFTPFYSALAYLIPLALVPLALVRRVLDTFMFSLRGFRASMSLLVGYGIRIYGSNILSTFGTQVDQLLVIALLTPANLGLYTVALNSSRVLNVFYTSLGIVLLPKGAGLEKQAALQLVGRLARLTTAVTTACGVLLALVMPFLLPHLYGHDFSAAVIISQILIAEAVIGSTIGVLSQGFIVTNRPGVWTVLQGIGLALTVPLMLLLIPRLGLTGAALSLLGSTSIRLVIALLCFPVILKVPAPSLLATGSDIRYLSDALRQKVARAN